MPARRRTNASPMTPTRIAMIGGGVLAGVFVGYKILDYLSKEVFGVEVVFGGVPAIKRGNVYCSIETGWQLGPPGCAPNEIRWWAGCIDHNTCKDIPGIFGGCQGAQACP